MPQKNKVAVGEYTSVQEVCGKFIRVASTVKPKPEPIAKHEKRYQQFRQSHPACKALFAQLCS